MKRPPIKVQNDKDPKLIVTTKESMGVQDPQNNRARTFNLPKDFRGELMKINNRKKALARQSNNLNNIEQVDEEVKEEAPNFNKRTKTPMLSKKEQFMLK